MSEGPLTVSITKPVCEPFSASWAVVMFTSAPALTTYPEFATPFTTCNDCELVLFKSSCGDSKFSTNPSGRPCRNIGKYGTIVKLLLYGDQASCNTTFAAVTVHRTRLVIFSNTCKGTCDCAICAAIRSSSHDSGIRNISPELVSMKCFARASLRYWRSITRRLRRVSPPSLKSTCPIYELVSKGPWPANRSRNKSTWSNPSENNPPALSRKRFAFFLP